MPVFILSQEIFNWSDIKSLRASSESEKASQYTYKSDRDLVVLTTVNAYLLVISDAATVDSIRAQVKTAQTLFQKTSDQHTPAWSPASICCAPRWNSRTSSSA